MTTAIARTKAEIDLAGHFEKALGTLPGGGWVRALREKAARSFAATGLPHRRIEEWKYTDLRERLTVAPPAAPGAMPAIDAAGIDAALGALGGLTDQRIVIVDGALRPELTRLEAAPTAVEVKGLAAALAAAPAWLEGKLPVPPGPIGALNAAFMSDGALVKVRAGQSVAKPILLVVARSHAEARSVALRNIVNVEAGAAATLVEVHIALGGAAADALANIVTDVEVADGGHLEHVKCVVERGRATHLSGCCVRLGTEAVYRGFQLTQSPALARNEIQVRFDGRGAKLDLSGAFLARHREHIDTTLVVDHAVPGCESRELFKGVLDGDAHGVFQGKIIVRPDAQKTDGKQMSQALMLSPNAQFSSKPELEIYADDVVCGHGATCAELDEDLLFYCRSRGIPLAEARAMLTESFIGEAIDKIETEAVREAVMATAVGWLRE